MKKKIFSLILVLMLPLLCLTGCSYNQSIFDLDYGFQKALVYEKGEWKEYAVSKWDDYENDMICIWTADGQVIYTSSNNIILYGKK